MEYLGSKPAEIIGTIHYGGTWPDSRSSTTEYVLPSGTFHDDFHVFAVEWEETEIRWYVDDVHYATVAEWNSTAEPYPAPFDVEFHMLLNLAVGGNLPGAPDANAQFPQEYVIDYVRVYQQAGPVSK
jgi:beta-glucanase (GH16 family)